MTEQEQLPGSSVQDDDLVTLYQQAVQFESAQPGAHLYTAVLSAAQQKAAGTLPSTVSATYSGNGSISHKRQAANDARWKIRALGGMAILGLVGLLASRFLPYTSGYEELAEIVTQAPYKSRGASASDKPISVTATSTTSDERESIPVLRDNYAETSRPAAEKADEKQRASKNDLPGHTRNVAELQHNSSEKNSALRANDMGDTAVRTMPFSADSLKQQESAPLTGNATKEPTREDAEQVIPIRPVQKLSAGKGSVQPRRPGMFSSEITGESEPVFSSSSAARKMAGPTVKADEAVLGKTTLSELLLAAAGNGDLNGVQRAVRLGAFINVRDADGHTALMRAAVQGHSAIVRYLMIVGADIALTDKAGRNAAALAHRAGHDALAQEISGKP